MNSKTLIRKVVEGFKTDMAPERKLRIAYLLQQYSMNATQSCLKELINYLPLGAIVSQTQINNLLKNGQAPSFEDLSNLFINDQLLSELLK